MAPENGVTREFGADARIEGLREAGQQGDHLALNALQDEVQGEEELRRSLQTHQRETVAQME